MVKEIKMSSIAFVQNKFNLTLTLGLFSFKKIQTFKNIHNSKFFHLLQLLEKSTTKLCNSIFQLI